MSEENPVNVHIHLHGLEGIVAALSDRSVVSEILFLLEKIMSGTQTLDQQLASLTTLAQKQQSDFAQFQTDVKAALAAIQSGGSLTPAQQTAIDNLTAIMTTTNSNITAANSALTSATSSSSTISGAGGGTVTGGGSATATRPPNP